MRNAGLFLQYHGITRLNQTYLFLRKIPFIGKKLPPSLPVGLRGKKMMVSLGLLHRLLRCLFHSAIILAVYYLPWKFIPWGSMFYPGMEVGDGFFQSFFFLGILGGPVIMRQGRQELDWTGYYFLKVFRFPAKSFFRSRVYFNLLRIAVGLLPPMLFMAWLLKDFPVAVMAYLSTLGMRLSIEAFTLRLFEKRGKTWWENGWVQILWVLLMAVLAFSPILGQHSRQLYAFVFPITLSGALWAYITLNKISYEKLVSGLSTTEELGALEDRKKAAEFIAVKLEDNELSSDTQAIGSDQKGYDYLHALIFQRIEKKLSKRAKTTTKVIAVLGVIIFGLGFFFRRGLANEIHSLFWTALRMSFFFSYLLSPGESFTKLLFLYMDKDLLPYPYYREPQAILRSLRLRMKKLLQVTAPITAVMLLSLLAFFGIFYRELGPQILLLFPVLVVQAAFFALYRLMVYYLLQPYTIRMEAKSPAAGIANGAVYLVSYMFLQIHSIGPLTIGVVLVVMALIVMSAPVLLKSMGPQKFKLRES